MSAEQLGEAQADRLEAAVFEQRRLSHMLRQRGSEIEALRGERERLADGERDARQREEKSRLELGDAEERISALGAERDRLGAAAADAELVQNVLREEITAARAELRKSAAARAQLDALLESRGKELGHAEYEARRADRRVVRFEAALTEARKQNRVQLDALAAELRESLAARDEARIAAAESVRGLEQGARDLGRARRQIELLSARERQCEALLADSDRTLAEVAEHLRRAKESRSWRWGHALAQAFRTLTFRRHSSRSALDAALERLEARGRVRTDAG